MGWPGKMQKVLPGWTRLCQGWDFRALLPLNLAQHWIIEGFTWCFARWFFPLCFYVFVPTWVGLRFCMQVVVELAACSMCGFPEHKGIWTWSSFVSQWFMRLPDSCPAPKPLISKLGSPRELLCPFLLSIISSTELFQMISKSFHSIPQMSVLKSDI